MKQIATLVIMILLLAGCNGSKHFAKLGAKQEAAGLTTEAANSYYVALLKNRNNLDAQIGMKKTGQLVLNGMLNDFAKAKNFGTNKEAVYAFHAARDYKSKIKSVGIDLLLADFYEQDYRAAKDLYLQELYDMGTTLMDEQRYADAEVQFNEIKSIEPNYKDTKELGDIAYIQPLYDEAMSAMQDERYREAYYNFDKVIARRADFKNAKALKKECLQKGTYTVAMLPFENVSGTTGLDAKVNAYMLQSLTSIDDPFLKIVDREHMEAILQEQKLQLSGVVDNATAVQVGELVGAQAILTGTVLSYAQQAGQLRSKSRQAYQAFQVKKLNATDGKYYLETQFKPTTYTEYYNSSSCSISFQFKLISLKTGEIIKTDIISKDLTDEVLYGKFDGDINSLYPAAGNGPSSNVADRRSLMNILNGRQDLRSTAALSEELFGSISDQLSSEINSIIKQLVP